MPDPYLITLLRQGADSWNDWRKSNPDITVDLHRAELVNIDLCGANLCEVDLHDSRFENINLKHANFRNSNLSRVVIQDSQLEQAIFSGANLQEASFNSGKLQKANFRDANLRNANFEYTKLSYVIFRDAELYDASFNHVDLEGANLIGVQALGARFSDVVLTGAYIQDWNINEKSIFQDIICDYIFFDYEFGIDQPKKRRPLNGNFASGEFVALIQKSHETIDLIFVNGIDWQAFFQSFQQLQSQYGDQEIGIKAIEKKDGGAFVVRLETAPEADKVAIESVQRELYNTQLQLREAHGELRVYREMSDVIRTLAGKPMESNQFNFNAPVGNVAGTNQGIQQTTQHNYAPEIKQTLAESAKEIQDLLVQLQEDNPADIKAVVEQKIKKDPTFRQRLQNALKEGGVETLKVLFAPIGIPIEVVRGWIEAEGSGA